MALIERFVTNAGAGAHDGTSEANAFSWTEMVTDSATSAAGTRYNIKKDGTYARTTTSDTLGTGTATSPKIYRGYLTTPGDGYLGRTNNNGALITTNFPVITYTTGRLIQGGLAIFECLNITAATSINGTVTLGASSIIRGCSMSNTSAASANDTALIAGSANGLVIDCDIFQTAGSGTGSAIRTVADGTRIIGCRCGSQTGQGIILSTTSAKPLIAFCTIFTCGTDAIAITQAQVATIMFNTLVGCTSDGIESIAQSNLNVIYGNMITDNAATGGTFGAASAFGVMYNRTRDNVSGAYSGSADWITATSWGEVTTDTGGPTSDYTTPGSDYTLVGTSPGRNVSFPYAASMGALQPASSSNGGSDGRIPSLTI